MTMLTSSSLLLSIFLSISTAAFAVSGNQIPRACSDPSKNFKFCDTSLPRSERVQDLISRLTVNEKLQMMTARRSPLGGVERLGVPEYDWGGNCIHGVQSRCLYQSDGSVRCPTSFPNPNALGAAFNRSVWEGMGSTIGIELRALWLQNVGENHAPSGLPHIGLDCWSPNIGIVRDVRWGRNLETPSEDPLINGLYGSAYSIGMQQLATEKEKFVLAIPTLKHFDANSLEGNWPSDRCPTGVCTRHTVSANITNYDLASSYLPAFRMSVEDGGALGVMCSYNEVNGVPSCANSWLLTDQLRSKWKFRGYVSSDSGAIQDIYSNNSHGYASNGTVAVAQSIKAGCDVDSGGWPSGHPWGTGSPFLSYGQNAIDAGLMTEAHDLDTALGHALDLRFRLGLFDPIENQPYWHIEPDVIRSPAHEAQALDATLQSMVLLRNRGGTLPITPGKTIAVIGPHADAQEVLVGNYIGEICANETFGCVVSPKDAIRAANRGGSTLYAPGLNSVSDNSTAGFPAAVAAAKQADVAVLFVGLDLSIEREGHDRHSITLPGAQQSLAEALIGTGTPTVVVLINGGMIAIDWLTSRADTLVEAFYPGFYGGTALASLLFGQSNRWGKLPVTIYGEGYTDELDMLNFDMAKSPGRTYRYYTGKNVLFPFGHGLSYTKFNVSLVPSAVGDLQPGDVPKTVVLKVTNEGSRDGDEVVMAFFSPPTNLATSEPASRIQKQLFDFERVHLPSKGSTNVSFKVSAASLSLYNAAGDRVVFPGVYSLSFENGAGASAHMDVVVSGTDVIILDKF